MKVLDGDDVRLSAKGRYAERDIVQVSGRYFFIVGLELASRTSNYAHIDLRFMYTGLSLM